MFMIPIGYRRTESWRILRSVRHGIRYEDYLQFADELYMRFAQSDENFYSLKEHAYNVKRAWNKPNLAGFSELGF